MDCEKPSEARERVTEAMRNVRVRGRRMGLEVCWASGLRAG
jgi:hypothetical protein